MGGAKRVSGPSRSSPEAFYKEYFGFAPSEPQRRCYESLYLARDLPLLATVELPTGEGKTEAVVAPFLAQFVDGVFPIAPRLVYVLPSRSLSDQTAGRICKYAHEIEKATKRQIIVNTQHGGHPEDPFFFSDVVVSTLDQFVYAYARAQQQAKSHPDISAGSIAASLVVFDEAHGYDPYTLSMVKAMIQILHAARVPVVLMSATLPPALKADLLPRRATATEITLTGLPRIQRQIPIKLIDEPLVEESCRLPGILTERLATARKALIVCNEVSRAQQLYLGLKRWLQEQGLLDALPVTLIHSRFTQQDRERLQGVVEQMLGENGTGGIVVSTQVCEAGLNLSAELVVTEFAPADALVQRAGRCARFKGESGEVWIFAGGEPAKYTYGNSKMGEMALDATLSYLRSNPDLDLGDWGMVQDFCRVLPYSTNEAAAAESLRELQEATLYADNSPQRIRVRDELSAYFWVGNAARKLPLTSESYRASLVSVSVRRLWGFLEYLQSSKSGGKKASLEQLVWKSAEGAYSLEEKGQPQAFRTYRLDPQYYSSCLGVCYDGPAPCEQ